MRLSLESHNINQSLYVKTAAAHEAGARERLLRAHLFTQTDFHANPPKCARSNCLTPGVHSTVGSLHHDLFSVWSKAFG